MQPIVIFGGMFSFTMLYWGMQAVLTELTAGPVWIVKTWGHDWLPSISTLGWACLLRKLEGVVQAAARASPTAKVTLIGHSAGGVLSRLFLSPRPFWGHAYGGLDYVDRLITLGSPHANRGGLTRGGRLSRWVERHYPGAYFPQVQYTSVAGKLIQGERAGTPRARWAYGTYEQIGGDGNAWGMGSFRCKRPCCLGRNTSFWRMLVISLDLAGRGMEAER